MWTDKLFTNQYLKSIFKKITNSSNGNHHKVFIKSEARPSFVNKERVSNIPNKI